MIKSKEDLHEYIRCDMRVYQDFPYRERIILNLTHDPLYEIAKYVQYLRFEEYYYNCRNDKVGSFLYLLFLRKKNKLGNKLGIKIPKNTVGKGLTVYHHGSIIINENARIGENAKLHGENCIGNNGLCKDAPIIGDNLDLGFGAMIIGRVQLGKNIRIGANAVVTKSFLENNVTLVGIPAKSV